MPATTKPGPSKNHTIKLRAAWREDALDCPNESLILLRNFGCPTGLEPNQRVWLLASGLTERTQVFLNENSLASQSGDMKVQIGEYLRPRNVIRIEIEMPADRAHNEQVRAQILDTLTDSIRLEIES